MIAPNYRDDLTPTNEYKPDCAHCKKRPAVIALDNGPYVCLVCWQATRIHGPITLDRGLIRRSDLDQHEKHVLFRRIERRG